MSESLRVGLVQMRGGVDPHANADAVEAMAREAAGLGAGLIATPEATNIVQRDGDALRALARAPAEDVVYQRLQALAAELKVVILAGSLMVRAEGGRIANRAHVFGSDGTLLAAYDKIHLFDVTISGAERYAESDTVRPGDHAVVAETPVGRLGLSICYDVRFPALYRSLALAGARMIAVPAAFTRHTGRAHWSLLVRARALDTGTFMLAPAQGGRHEDGRSTWGRSMVVDPWGEVVAAKDDDEPGVLMADLSWDRIAAAHNKVPVLEHARAFSEPEVAQAASDVPASVSGVGGALPA